MKNLIDGTSAFKIDYFDTIGIEMQPEVENYRSGQMPKNMVLETFKRIDKLPFSNVNVRFSDGTWDFSSITDLPISKNKLKFNFDPNSAYSETLKMYVLNEIIKKNTKIRVLNDKVQVIWRALRFFEAEGYRTYSQVPKTAFKRFFKSFEDSCSYNTICAYKGKLLMFTDFYERTFIEIQDKSIKKYLEDRNTSKLNDIKSANKTPEVPIDYFPIFLDGVKSIMRNKNESSEDRVTAASVVLYSQIGFRTAELFTVKVNSIKSVFSPNENKPLYYLDFNSYKSGAGDNDSKIAHTYINELSLEAYKLLEELCREQRDALGVDTLLVVKFQKNPVFNVGSYNDRYRKFVLRHWKELCNLNIHEYHNELSCIDVGNCFTVQADGYSQFDKNADWARELKMNDKIYYPTTRQFRVSVCTSLYRQEIPLHYIRKHMNHLSEDMAAYYIRPRKNIEKEYSETVYRAVFKDGSKMLGQNSDAFIQKINEFIGQNQLNIKENTDEVIEILANKFPLRSKIGGMCIRCGDVVPCASNNSTDVIYCAFNMCPNHCHMFFMADISYCDYVKHRDIVNYNKENGFKKAYQKELHKLRYSLENALIPELRTLEEELVVKGEGAILEKYPQLTSIINNLDDIKQEVQSWIQPKE